MKKIYIRKITYLATILVLAIYSGSQSIAQERTSTGRSAGVTLDMNNNSYKAIQRIRNLINKGDFDKAKNRSLRFIKTENRENRKGIGTTEYYDEAYNCLCVSLTGLGKVEDAIKACNRSLELNPKHWESLKSRATIHYMTLDFPKSLDDFELALENAPDIKAVTDILKQNIGVVKSKIK